MSRSIPARLDALAPAALRLRPPKVQRDPLDVLGAHLDACLGADFFASVLGLDVLPESELAGLGGAALARLRHARPDVPPPPGCPPGQSVATMLRVAFSDSDLDALGLGFVKRVRLPHLDA